MAKSLRSKVKRAFRSKKRESGVYAATEAARLDRLNAKLAATIQKRSNDDDHLGEDPEGMQISEVEKQGGPKSNRCSSKGAYNDIFFTEDVAASTSPCHDGDGPEQKPATQAFTGISTHGPRGSRREEWRKSKGMDPIPKRKGMNRQGGLAARRRAGRASRRR